jgi:hypothetical protein
MVPTLTWNNLLILGALLVITFLAISIFNGLIQARARTREAWAGIAAQLKRRADLVPNLVSAIKGYAAHELKLMDVVAHLCRFRSVEFFQAEATNLKTVQVSSTR